MLHPLEPPERSPHRGNNFLMSRQSSIVSVVDGCVRVEECGDPGLRVERVG